MVVELSTILRNDPAIAQHMEEIRLGIAERVTILRGMIEGQPHPGFTGSRLHPLWWNSPYNTLSGGTYSLVSGVLTLRGTASLYGVLCFPSGGGFVANQCGVSAGFPIHLATSTVGNNRSWEFKVKAGLPKENIGMCYFGIHNGLGMRLIALAPAPGYYYFKKITMSWPYFPEVREASQTVSPVGVGDNRLPIYCRWFGAHTNKGPFYLQLSNYADFSSPLVTEIFMSPLLDNLNDGVYVHPIVATKGGTASAVFSEFQSSGAGVQDFKCLASNDVSVTTYDLPNWFSGTYRQGISVTPGLRGPIESYPHEGFGGTVPNGIATVVSMDNFLAVQLNQRRAGLLDLVRHFWNPDEGAPWRPVPFIKKINSLIVKDGTRYHFWNQLTFYAEVMPASNPIVPVLWEHIQSLQEGLKLLTKVCDNSALGYIDISPSLEYK